MTRRTVRRFRDACVAGFVLVPAAAVNASPASDTVKARIEHCVVRAALHHRVNHDVLRAILRVESNLNPSATGRNADGSVDLGIGQINSRHFPVLSTHGIYPAHLMDGCVGAFVAAWHLSTLIARHGNSWTSIARYHSATPALNHRYQLLLANELVSAGVIAGVSPPVALARRGSAPPQQRRTVRDAMVPSIVVDNAAPTGTAQQPPDRPGLPGPSGHAGATGADHRRSGYVLMR